MHPHTPYYCATHARTTFETHVPAPLFRAVVHVPENAEISPLQIATPGFYELWLDGTHITKGYLAPYIANPDDLVYADSYTLQDKLTPGDHVLAIVLGNGYQNNIDTVWDFDHGKHNGAPRFALEWQINDTAITPTDFTWTESPITFDNYRCGVHYDARREIPDLWNPELDTQDWQTPLRAETPRGTLRMCEAEPIRIQQELAPVSVTAGTMTPHHARPDVDQSMDATQIIPVPTDTEHGYIYDFGINTAGIFRLTIQGTPGQRIVIDAAERLIDGVFDPTNISFFYPDGYGQRDVYICKGEGTETFIPSFTYHGARYLYVSGITEDQATPELLTFLEMHSDLTPRATFTSSDDTVNTLWTLARRSDLANFYYFPTDCPHREKNGWTGDASMSAEHFMVNLKAEVSLTEWMRSVCLSQSPSGALPGIVPTTGWGFDWGNGPAWDSALFEIPYQIWIYSGDTTAMEEAAPHMLRYLAYIAKQRDAHGIIAIGLGDWCPVGRTPDDYLMPLGLSDSIMVYDMCQKAVRMFTHLGDTLSCTFANTLGQELRTAIRTRYLDPQTLLFEGDCQSSQAMGIYYGLYDPAEVERAYAHLIRLIEASDRSMDVGFLGGRVLFHVLSRQGDTDLALHMITKKTYPSYGNLIERGATSLWEMFLPEPQLSGSENHHFWGDISHWFVRHLAGIHVNPYHRNPNELLLIPQFATELSHVSTQYEAPDGTLEIAWKRVDHSIEIDIHNEAGLPVTLQLPTGFWFEDDHHRRRADIASGTYTVTSAAQ